MTHHVYRWHCHPDPRLRDSKDTIEGHQIRARDHGVTGGEWDEAEIKLRRRAYALSSKAAEWLEKQLTRSKIHE